MSTNYTVTITAATSQELDEKILELASRLTNLDDIATTDKQAVQSIVAPSQPPVLQVPPVPSITPPAAPAPPIAKPPAPTPPEQAPNEVSPAKHTKKEVTDMGRAIMALGENETKGVKDILKKHSVTGITTIPMELVETMFEEFTNLQSQIDSYNSGNGQGTQGTQAPPAATPPAAPPAPPLAAPPVPPSAQAPTVTPPAPPVSQAAEPKMLTVSPTGTVVYPRLVEIAQKTSALGGADVKDDIMGIIQQTGVMGLSEVSPEWFEWLEFHLVELHNKLVSQKG